MEQNICAIIKDVLPLYQDGATSDDSNQIIEEHLEICEECKRFIGEVKEDGTSKKETLLARGNTSEQDFISDQQTLKFEHIAKKLRKRRILIAVSFAIIFGLILIIQRFIFPNMIISGESMEPTLMNGESYLINRTAYWFQKPERGDIVVAKQDSNLFVKRIIGLPNEKLQIIDGRIYINNELLEEDYSKDFIKDAGILERPIILGDDEYFVLGDNMDISLDSRNEGFGLVKESNLLGEIKVKSLINLKKYMISTKESTARINN